MGSVKRLLAVLLCAVLLSTCVFAGEIDPSLNDCTLTVRCKHSVEDVRFSIWRVAKISETAHFTKVGSFVDAKVNVNDTDNWIQVAETLAGFVESRDLEPLATDKTNKKGQAYFDELRTGLYLVMGERYTVGDRIYQTEPFLVSLPTRSDNTLPWEYDVITAVKPSDWVDDVETDSVSVLKIWSGDDDSKIRPASITVELLCDGKVYDTVTLNRRNNWSYSWANLPAGHTWRVTEDQVPDGYFVLVNRNGNDFVIVNTYQAPEEPIRPDPDVPTDPGIEIPDDDVPLEKPEELPKTGTTQWMVPLLLAAGALLFLMGLLRRRQEG